MKKKLVASLLAFLIVMTGCGSTQKADLASDEAIGSDSATNTNDSLQNKPEENKEPAGDTKADTDSADNEVYYDANLVPSVESYKVAEDFSNVEYEKEFDNWFNPEHEYASDNAAELREALIKNNFAVEKGSYDEFFDVYESNRYQMFPNFITVDSLMHTYHLYFAHLIKQTEKGFLADRLKSLTQTMMEESINQYKELEGTDWKEAALRNMEFFYIAELLQDNTVSNVPYDAIFNNEVQSEYDKIMAAEGIEECEIIGHKEDYTQYKPRGYYEGDEELEKYFRTMMWYGRIAFSFENREMVKSAVLMNLAIDKSPDAWKDIYEITGFFAGASDDPGYDLMISEIESAYGKVPEVKDLAENKDAFNECVKKLEALDPPKVNSIPVMEGEDPVIPSYRFMGQRFTIDAAIMQKLVYSAVKENENGDRRYLPDTLDVAAALGSDVAQGILQEQGATEYENYNENLFFAKEHFDNSDENLWGASLYSGWLHILRPLFEQKGEGYPSYMQSAEWTKKNLETFAGSYAELKHDTILYAKQIMAEMGGGDMEILDDRGYVDPQPVIYSRFISLSEKTQKGLEEMGMLGENDRENLEKLSEIAKRLLEISEKELTNTEITEDDYEFIRCYGGYIEHLWKEVNKDMEEDLSYSYQAPSPVVADIATDPNGAVLEVGTGKVDTVYVVFPIDGKLHIGRGSAYSFYQFIVPISERMTDTEWRNRLSGGYLDDNWNWVEAQEAPDQPQWTSSYRVGSK